jgi:hypothetical protein
MERTRGRCSRPGGIEKVDDVDLEVHSQPITCGERGKRRSASPSETLNRI